MSSAPSRVVTLKINGRDIAARSDQTILQAARENQIDIPTMCYLEGLSGWGACRMCLVEIAGSPKLVTSCVTRVGEGMDVTTDSDRLKAYRRTIVEMMFAERNHICSVCVSNGACDLQSMAQRVGVDHVHVPNRYPALQLDSSHDLFRLDHNRCILCTRCVRVCDEIEGAHTWDVRGRGVEACVITDLNTPWGESDTCTSCGKCVQVCPTGALVQKGTAVAEMHKQREFLPYLQMMRGARHERED